MEVETQIKRLNEIRSFLSDNRDHVSWDDIPDLENLVERIKTEISYIKKKFNKEINDKRDKFYQDNLWFFDGMRGLGFRVNIEDAFIQIREVIPTSSPSSEEEGDEVDRIDFHFGEKSIECYLDNHRHVKVVDVVPWEEIVKYYKNEEVLFKEGVKRVVNIYNNIESVAKKGL